MAKSVDGINDGQMNAERPKGRGISQATPRMDGPGYGGGVKKGSRPKPVK